MSVNRNILTNQIVQKESFLCVGLDTEIHKIPSHIQKLNNPLFEFNKRIIDATHDLAVAYKPNIAFYESLGVEGWKALEKTTAYIRSKSEKIFIIADAKRGDIGNTSRKYAETFFKQYDFDAITINPYMGEDSVKPFLEFPDKWVIILALTSNPGSQDFQFDRVSHGKRVFEKVLEKSSTWGNPDNTMYVVGATRANMFVVVREHVPNHFILVPGVGSQGGNMNDVARYGMIKDCGLLVNASRSIIYASDSIDFEEAVRKSALDLQLEMKKLLKSS
jgi:orotidine-5'-phosphate decarboxylase